MPMRDSHPGLFRAMVKMGAFGFLNALGMLVWPSRMPEWLPSHIVAFIGITASVGIIVGSFARVAYADMNAAVFTVPPPSRLVALGRISLAVLSVLYVAMSVSLFIGWQPAGTAEAATAVTQSLDRVFLYALAAGGAFDMLREPPNNPVTARPRTEPKG